MSICNPQRIETDTGPRGITHTLTYPYKISGVREKSDGGQGEAPQCPPPRGPRSETGGPAGDSALGLPLVWPPFWLLRCSLSIGILHLYLINNPGQCSTCLKRCSVDM